MDTPPTPIRLDYLRIQNYRALHDVELRDLTPLTVLVGPNGSGKSTLMDALSFVQECFDLGLRRAWAARGRFQELRTRGAEGPIAFEMRYQDPNGYPIFYQLWLNQDDTGPYVMLENIDTEPVNLSDFQFRPTDKIVGKRKFSGAYIQDSPNDFPFLQLHDREALAASVMGQFQGYDHIARLRSFVLGWHISAVSTQALHSASPMQEDEHLSPTGENVANVLLYLRDKHPDRLDHILKLLTEWVPHLEGVDTAQMPDGRLLLHLKDRPFERPIMARFASDGTLALLAYLLLLHDPHPPALIGLEEPENHVHPRLLGRFAEECRGAAFGSQVIMTTHAPYLLDALTPEEVWILHRDEQGHSHATRAADILPVRAMMDNGALLGDLWMEGYMNVGDPLTNAGKPLSGR